MRKVILLTLLMPFTAFGQIVVDFESGNVNRWVQSIEGHWKADSTEAISGKFSLHHSFDNPESGSDMIGIPISDLHPSLGPTRWSFLVKHGYDASSSNNWAVFLLSDSGPEELLSDGNTNGFCVGVNLTGYDDSLRLWKVKSGTITTVMNSNINWQTDIGIEDPVKIIVERSIEGNWFISVNRMDEDIVGTASGADSELFYPGWFGIRYNYSSTRDRLLWFDDLNLEGTFHEDNEAPVVTECRSSGMNSVEITFSELPADESIVAENFSINGTENRSISVQRIKGISYRVEFAVDQMNKLANNLEISNLCDNSGNCDQNIQIQFTPSWAEPGDVIISEIMADPLPEVSLPGKEYIEISNRTKFSFNLKNWQLASEDQNTFFPEKIIQPMETMIICLSKDTSLFTRFGKVIGLKQFPSLTDGGKILILSDSSGTLVHGVEYSSDWYNDELKSRGGWSLEMIDTQYPFFGEQNWRASVSRNGGTPGMINSVSGHNPDISFYGVRNIFPDDSLKISVTFSEPVFNLFENIDGISINEKEIFSLYPADHLFREFIIKVKEPLLKQKRYEFKITGDVKDFAGNVIQTRTFIFGLPEPAGLKDILFNEILFNPLPGDPDYLEFYNCSEKVIDASRLQFVTIKDGVGDTSQLYPVSNEKRCIMPDSYYAITTNKEKIFNRYYSTGYEFLFETGSFPSLSDDEGHLVLFNRELDIIDETIYNEDMHSSLLSGYEGIALEKAGKDTRSEDATNWHSASESFGWGTPGAPNSLIIEEISSEDNVVFSSSKISPDNDGYEDFLKIGFRLTGTGNVVSVMIFDETGTYVKKLAANLYIGSEASLIWDGTANDGSPVNTGIYVVLISLFDDRGKTEKWKKVCTVVRN